MWSYGERRSSNDLFLFHGFVMPGNALNEDAVLFDQVVQLAAWYLDLAAGSSGGSTVAGLDRTALMEEAEAVASEAMRQASAACTRGPRGGVRVVGTSSAILIPTAAASSGLESRSRAAGGASSAGAAPLQDPEAQAAALACYAALDLRSGERVTGSLRLHEPSWGDSSRHSDDVPELMGRGDGLVDVRLVAVSEFLCRRLASRRPASDGPRGVGAVMGAHEVVLARASELLQGFSTSLAEDRELLQASRDLQRQGADGGQLERRILTLSYRIAKKECLATLERK